MTASPKYHRVLLKLSGEALLGDRQFGISPQYTAYLAEEIRKVHALGVQVGVVLGGGNWLRGADAAEHGIDRATADYMGMLAMVINALALRSQLEAAGLEARVQTALTINEVAEPYIRLKAISHLEKGRIVIFAAGTGNPFFTTDTAAALRGNEIGADVMLMAKSNVDGVYSADPRKDPDAVKLDHLTYTDALVNDLGVMDGSALSLCRDNDVRMRVFGLEEAGNVTRALQGEKIGTLITAS